MISMYFLQNIPFTKSSNLRCAGRAECKWIGKICTKFQLDALKVDDHLQNITVDGRLILKSSFVINTRFCWGPRWHGGQGAVLQIGR